MNKTAIIVATNLKKRLNIAGDYIGVEKGIVYLLNNNIAMISAMCDLDSVKDEKKRQEIKNMNNFIHKQDQVISDGEYAIKWAIKNKYQNILFYCGGTRIDMDAHVMNLVLKYNVKAIINENHLVVKLHQGKNIVSPLIDNSTFTIFAFKAAVINIEKALYNITNYQVAKYDTRLVSNAFVKNQSIIVEIFDKNPEMILISSKE